MTDEARAALQAELIDLKRKLSKRSDMPGFATNAAAIGARIAEIETALSEG
jgi:hypothetical protein